MKRFPLLPKALYTAALGAVCSGLLFSCQNDDIPSDSYYTFTGYTCESYLADKPEFSIFNEFLDYSSLTPSSGGTSSSIADLLSSYGYYTVFAPDNEAMTAYLHKLGDENCNSRRDLYNYFTEAQVDSITDVVAQMHVVSSSQNLRTYTSENFEQKLLDQNLYTKVIYVSQDGDSYIINDVATITERDIEVHNGCVHRINAVLEPTGRNLDEFFNEYPQFSIFRKALEATKVSERMNLIPEQYDYEKDNTDYSYWVTAVAPWDNYLGTPDRRKFAYTMFIEPDDVYTAAIPELASPGADTLALLQAYALAWFESEYTDMPELLERGKNTAITDSDNYFNRFVAYHILNKKVDRTDFTRYNMGMPPDYVRYHQWAETLAPNTMLYMSAGANGHAWPGGVDPDPNILNLNPSPDNQEVFNAKNQWRRPTDDGVHLGNEIYYTENGYIHPIEDILVYPRSEFKRTRFRLEISSIFPEVMSNDYRYWNVTMGRLVFPHDYLSHIHFISESTVFELCYPNRDEPPGAGRNGYEGDEWMCYNNYDVILRLPPVPRGTYEVRFGYTRAATRGCAQFYLAGPGDYEWGTDNYSGFRPCGIPIDLTVTVKDHGWKSDEGLSEAEIAENDKEMRARGFMKGPNSWRANNGGSTFSLRETANSGEGDSPQRAILGQITLDEDGPIYVRARNATTMTTVELMMDYFEICPDNIYNNPYASEPID